MAALTVGCAAPAPSPQGGDARRAEAHAKLGASYMQSGHPQAAMEELRLALSIDPDHPLANYVMAVLQVRLQNYDEAERYFRRANRHKKDYVQAQHDYGVFLCRRGKFGEAMKWFAKALSNPLHRAPALTHVQAAECLLRDSKPDLARAERHLKEALAANPRLPDALYAMARVRFAAHRHLSARGYLERYLEVGRETPAVLLLAVRIEQALGADDVAAQYATRLRTKFPGSEQVRTLETLRRHP